MTTTDDEARLAALHARVERLEEMVADLLRLLADQHEEVEALG
jgi:t-SNARE complex subunit (syntaxin)